MSKLQIVSRVEGTRVPFLRGILTRCLLDAGLSFDDAYQVASRVREALLSDADEDSSEVTTDQLVERVVEELAPFGPEYVERYTHRPAGGTILIRWDDGHTSPYSRGRHRAELQASGVSPDDATRVITAFHEELVGRGVAEVSWDELRRLTHERLAADLDSQAARRYDVWNAYRASDRPLILLVGGAPGSGKSTIASQLAHMLEIPRSQSTDMLREVMRTMVPRRLLPVLHSSSFNAWEQMPVVHEQPPDDRMIAGYLMQTELLSVACEAVFQRALSERISVVVEGVHVHPSMLEVLSSAPGEAIVVPIMLAVLKPAELKRRIGGRGREVPERRAKRYLDAFDMIWRLQSYLLSEADRAGIPIIANDDKERTVQQIMLTVMHELTHVFDEGAASDRA